MNQRKNALFALTLILLFACCTQNAPVETSTSTTQETTATTTTAAVTSTTGAQQSYDISLERKIQKTAMKAGETIRVEIVMAFGDNKPQILGLTEDYPSGWTVTDVSNGGKIQDNAKIEWLFWPLGSPVQDTTVSYRITSPAEIEGTYFFNGKAVLGKNQDAETGGMNNVSITK